MFKLSTTGKLTTLYSFCSRSGCADGGEPDAGLVRDAAGSLRHNNLRRRLFLFRGGVRVQFERQADRAAQLRWVGRGIAQSRCGPGHGGQSLRHYRGGWQQRGRNRMEADPVATMARAW